MSNFKDKKIDYKQYVVDSQLRYFKPHASNIQKEFSRIMSLKDGLMKTYDWIENEMDKKGSNLFESICSVPKNNKNINEISILKKLEHDLPSYLNENVRLVELGSGASVKTRLILDVFTKLQAKTEYFPIDISEILTESSEQLLKDYPTLNITGIIDTYEGGLEFLQNYDDKQNLIILNELDNFSPNDGEIFLKKIFSTMKKGDLFLIGLDLVKDKKILESAYDDPSGVTAKFNLNVLSRINDELDANFIINNFSHYSIYNENDQRIEMNLKSLIPQSVIIKKSNLSLNLDEGELIHTEYSHKYNPSQIKTLLCDIGFEIKNMWLDDKKYFSLTLVSKN